jgi:hypothetical protein
MEVSTIKKRNPFIFLFLISFSCAIMYFIAFHKERNINKNLKKQIKTLIINTKLKNEIYKY